MREDNKLADKTYTWSYDVGGNITEKRVYDYSAHSAPMGEYPSVSYTYETTGWKDQLTSFNGQSIIYDEIGNPTTYKGNNLAWTHVRRLASYGANTFEYGADGIRTKKNDITYALDGNKILRETDGGARNITYYYGTNGVVGFNYNGTDYYYRKNLQGDVIAIYTATGALVAEYVYDAWGKVTVFDLSAENIGTLNPFRYRSYYYDTETGLYYLNSRYYDPEVGRFINADDVQYLDPETLGGLSLYAYCLDNPVMYADPSGCFCFVGAIILAGAIVGGLLGALSAASTGGNVWESAIEGCLTGALGAACGILILNPYVAVCVATAGGAAIDLATQVTSQYINNKSVNLSKIDGWRVAKTAFQTGLCTAIPAFGEGAGNAVDAFSTALIWAECSTIVVFVDIFVTNAMLAAEPSYKRISITPRGVAKHGREMLLN